MGLCTPIPDGPRSRTQLPAGTRNQLVYDAVRHRVKRVHYVVRHQMAGREGFNPSRELYPPSPLSRRVLSATHPPPRQGSLSLDSIHPSLHPSLSILTSRWKLPADQARPRCGDLDARWRSGRRPVPGARSGTHSRTATSARCFFPISTASRCMSCVFSCPPAAPRRSMTRRTASTRLAGSAPACPPFASIRRITNTGRSEEHTSELQSQSNLVCRLLLEKKKKIT